MPTKAIYLDYNATTPVDERVADAMLPYLYEHFGNPSSSHMFGIEAKKGVEKARAQIANMLGCKVDEIIFTSGGSESNNQAIIGAALANQEHGNHIISSSIEHPAVLEVCDYLRKNGFKITILPVDGKGRVNPRDVEAAITSRTILISIMHANNEIGTIEPIKYISDIAHSHYILMHTDAAQSIGKIPVRVDDLGVDLLSIAGHKLYAPKGIGVLYIRTGTEIEKIIHGADHERNLRAGTENVLEIVGLGKACELVDKHLEDYTNHFSEMRDQLESKITREFPWAKINGDLKNRLPNTSNISFKGIEANLILSELATVAASAGAACHAEQVDISHVLEAMHISHEIAMGTIRFSTGRMTTDEEIKFAANEIVQVIKKLKPSTQGENILVEKDKVRLTQYTQGLGCACKLRPQLLESVLAKMPIPSDSKILVGTETGDDAAVFSINEDLALVQTVDFFTPIVDDPYQFGAVSAANSISDIYAMGATPLFALNIVGFPSNRLPISVLEEILRGAYDKAAEAGITIIGGHTVDDTEPKFGLAVTGSIDPKKIITNANAQPGDKLVLTKPIGTGIITTAIKQGMASERDSEEVYRVMAQLNNTGAELLQTIQAHACTDITGFGLLGHLLGMVRGSHVSAIISADSVPFLENAYSLAASGIVPGGTKNNQNYTNPFAKYTKNISATTRLLLNDAQTSGGLLVSLDEKNTAIFIKSMEKKGIHVALIGEIIPECDPRILIQ
jgi:cysteine desulfurase NifS/selenium donor protein